MTYLVTWKRWEFEKQDHFFFKLFVRALLNSLFYHVYRTRVLFTGLKNLKTDLRHQRRVQDTKKGPRHQTWVRDGLKYWITFFWGVPDPTLFYPSWYNHICEQQLGKSVIFYCFFPKSYESILLYCIFFSLQMPIKVN